MDIVEEYSDLEFDEERHFVGNICSREHDWCGESRSIRYKRNGDCVQCAKDRSKKSVADRRVTCPECKGPMNFGSMFCKHCAPIIFKHHLGKPSPKKGKQNLDKKKRADYLEEHVCEECGILFKISKYKAGKFCSRECSAESQKTRVTKNCDYCGVLFEFRPCRIGRKKYCSKKCEGEARITLPDIECPTCYKYFHPKDKNRKYCSRECWINRSLELAQCVYCGSSVCRNASKNKGLTFCDRKCLGKWKNKTRPRVLLKCPGCGNFFWTWKSKPTLTCSNTCADRMRFATKSSRNREELRGLSRTERVVYNKREGYYKWKYWKEVRELLWILPDIVVIGVLEKINRDIQGRMLTSVKLPKDVRFELLVEAITREIIGKGNGDMKRVIERQKKLLVDSMDGRSGLSRHEHISLHNNFQDYLYNLQQETKRVVIAEFNGAQPQKSSLDANGNWIIAPHTTEETSQAEE